MTTVGSATALSRWSCVERTLPAVAAVKKIDVFDFDNTLFLTPTPRRSIWAPETLGLLMRQDAFHNGSWWHDSKILRAVGGGIEKMEPVAWEGWWAEDVVTASRHSIQDPTVLSVLMTGRSVTGYADLIARIAQAKGLKFDMIVLKPEALPNGEIPSSTAAYKNAFFRDALLTYTNADLSIWEDRKKQAEAFSKYLHQLSETWSAQGPSAPRPGFDYDIHLVDAGSLSQGSPEDEVAQVTRMINEHNNAIAYGNAGKSSFPYKLTSSRLFTGYVLTFADSDRLKKLIDLPENVDVEEVRILADNIMVSYNPPSQSRIKQAGGMGSWHKWKVVTRGSYNDSVWAVQVQPTDPTPEQSQLSYVILCHKPRVKASELARQITNWTPVAEEQQIEINTRFQDKLVYRVEEDRDARNKNEIAKRQRVGNSFRRSDVFEASAEDFPALGSEAHDGHTNRRGGQNEPMSAFKYRQQGREGQGRGRGGYGQDGGRGHHGGRGGRGNRGGARGSTRGGGGSYRSLDDASRNRSSSGQMQY